MTGGSDACRAMPITANSHGTHHGGRQHEPLMRTQNRRCAGPECAAEEIGIEVARVVAEELGRPKLKDERELWTMANVRELQGASVVTRKMRTVLVPGRAATGIVSG